MLFGNNWSVRVAVLARTILTNRLDSMRVNVREYCRVRNFGSAEESQECPYCSIERNVAKLVSLRVDGSLDFTKINDETFHGAISDVLNNKR